MIRMHFFVRHAASTLVFPSSVTNVILKIVYEIKEIHIFTHIQVLLEIYLIYKMSICPSFLRLTHFTEVWKYQLD